MSEAGELPPDAEVSQDLIEALARNDLNPGDIEVVTDESGRSVIRPRSAASTASRKTNLSQALGGVKQGHLYHEPKKGKMVQYCQDFA